MRKLLSILLAVVMILALAVPAVAAGDEDFTNPNLMGHAPNMTYYEGGYGAVPSRYQCMIDEGETGYAEWFPIAFGDPVVENWPTEVGTHTVHFIVTTTVEGAGDTEYTFPFSMNITVLELPATSGQCGENMYWEFDTATDTLTISGTGDMYTIAEDNESFWNEQYGYEPGWWYLPVRHIVVKEGVENLSNYAFFQNWNGYYAILESLELPTSLQAIPEQGMVCSTAMKKLVIPEGITSLTGWPFGSPGNSFLGLQEIYLPSTLKEFDPLTLVFSGLDSRKGTITMQSIHYAGSQEQWDGIARVESAYLNELLGENSDFFRESFVGPIDEILAGFVVPEGCNHTWKDATCDKPKTCTSCGATEGKPAGHIYTDGVDGTCNVCGIHRETTEQRTVMHMFRMYDPNSGEHFYTGSVEERDFLVSVGWNYEGVGFTFSRTTGMPVYRLYDPVYGEHLYTMDEAERDMLIAQGWNIEGVAFNSAYDTEVPQYRLHNPNAKRGAYHFTASIAERDMLIALGWEYQGIGFYSAWK